MRSRDNGDHAPVLVLPSTDVDKFNLFWFRFRIGVLWVRLILTVRRKNEFLRPIDQIDSISSGDEKFGIWCLTLQDRSRKA